MKRTALLKHLTSMGCRLKREGGEHSIWYNPANAKQTSVPRHREIKDLLVKLICK
ncbi:MAG: type II toxin-antitoxin system HicA family toxin, partial [Planctomycetaceae bacterium]|nr:type II toxin-antitoxin system HicA family toxin [Planctomycetaceae bacterium]